MCWDERHLKPGAPGGFPPVQLNDRREAAPAKPPPQPGRNDHRGVPAQGAYCRRIQVVVVVMADQQQVYGWQPSQAGRGKPPARTQDPGGKHRIHGHDAAGKTQEERGMSQPGQPPVPVWQRSGCGNRKPGYPFGGSREPAVQPKPEELGWPGQRCTDPVGERVPPPPG